MAGRFFSILFACLIPGWAFGSGGVTYHGRLLRPNGQPVLSPNVQFRIQIRTDANTNCLMYEEIHSRNLAESQGVFSITLNESPTVANTEPFTLAQAFRNLGKPTFLPGKCSISDDVTFGPTSSRQIAVSFNDGTFPAGTWEPLPNQTISFVPMAFEATTLTGHKPENFLRVLDPDDVPQVLDPWSPSAYSALTGLVGSVTTSSGTVTGISVPASGFTGSLSGDVTGTQGATSVVKIQGKNVSNANPSNGDVLSWDAGTSTWRPVSPATGGGGDVMSTRTLTAGTGLTGGGDLSADRTFAVNVGTGANQIPQLDGSGKLAASVLPSSVMSSGTTAGGDLTGTYPNPTIAANAVTASKINDGAVGPSKLSDGSADGQVMRYDGSDWQIAKLNYKDLVNNISSGSPWPTTSCAAGEVITWSSVVDGFRCQAFTITETDPTIPSQASHAGKILQTNGTAASWVDPSSLSVLGNYVQKSGDTMTGALNLPANGLVVGTNQLVASGGSIGIGTASPSAKLVVSKNTVTPTAVAGASLQVVGADATTNMVSLQSFGSVSAISYRAAGGTAGSPGPLLNGNEIGNLTFSGYGSTAYHSGSAAKIAAFSAEDWSDVSGAAELRFYTRPSGSVASSSQRLRIDKDGNFQFGASSGTSAVFLSPSSDFSALNPGGVTTEGALIQGPLHRHLVFDLRNNDVNDAIAFRYSSDLSGAMDTVGFVFRGDGRVGIGTTAPTEKLEVAGNIKATQVCIGTDCRSAWPGTGGGGTVTSITAGTGLTGGTITGSGTIGLGTELTGLNNISGTGFMKRTAAGSYSTQASLSLTSDVSGTLPIANGGTGATTQAAAINNLLPSQSGNANKILQTNGTNVSWVDTPATGLTALTGDVTASGSGSVTATIANNAVNSAKISDGTVGVADLNFAGSMATNTGIVVRNGTQFFNKTCAGNETLIWSVANGWSCSSVASLESDPKIGANTTNYLSKWNGTSLVASGVFENGGNVGIGTAAPAKKLDVVGDGRMAQTGNTPTLTLYGEQTANIQSVLHIFGATNSPYYGANISMVRSRGTTAAPSAVLNNDVLGGLYGTGYGTTGWSDVNAAAIRMRAAEDWTDTAQGTAIDFATAPLGSKSRNINMTLDPAGRLGVGESLPLAKLHVTKVTASAPTALGDEASIYLESKPSAGGAQGYVGSIWFGSREVSDTEGTNRAAGIVAYMPNDVTTTSAQTDLMLMTTPAGSLTALERMRIASDGNIGIGTSAPANKLDIVNDGGTSGADDVVISSYANGSTPAYILRRARGSLATPSPPIANDALGVFQFRGHSGSDWVTSAEISSRTENLWSATTADQNAALVFSTTAAGSGSEKMRITSGGNVGIGTQSPPERLTIGSDANLVTDSEKVLIQSKGYAGLIVNGDTSNTSGEPGGAYVGFRLDGLYSQDGVSEYLIGQANPGGTAPDGRAFAGGLSNAMVMTTMNTASLQLGANASSALTILSSGNVGVGTTAPSEKLHVLGNLRVQGSTNCVLGNGSGGTSCSSDERLKAEIREIENPLSKILNLRGVSFVWNEKSLAPGRPEIGVIAQDVEKVFPTAVSEDESGFKRVDYAVLVAPLISAVKEIAKWLSGHDQEIASLKAENQALRERLDRLERRMNERAPASD